MSRETSASEPMRVLRDQLGRPMHDLRISVIDRCNLRCTFCMPAERNYTFLPRRELLSFEEISRLARLFCRLGARKIRLTGGEPLLRAEIEKLVGMLAEIPELEDLALTTNGQLLESKATALRDAGLRRVTVSLQALDDESYGRINGQGARVRDVLRGIEKAVEVGLAPVKINVVVMQGFNEHDILELARFFKERRQIVRFIEYMDVGTLNGWNRERVVTAREILQIIRHELPVEPVEKDHPGEVALRFRYCDDGVEVGAIASVTQPFCGDCSRVRLSSEGKLYTCLFAADGLDLKQPIRSGASDQELEDLIAETWSRRIDRYSEERAEALRLGRPRVATGRIEMFRIGG